MILAIGTASLALLVSFVAAWGAFVVPRKVEMGLSEPYDDTGLSQRLAEIEVLMQRLLDEHEAVTGWRDDVNIAVADGIKHIDRAESRIRSTVSRARKELERHGVESPGLEAEDKELRELNGDRSAVEGVPALPEPMERAPFDHRGIPGEFAVEDFRRSEA